MLGGTPATLPSGELYVALRRLQALRARARERHVRIREYLQEKSVWIDVSGNVPNRS
jgi:hypothetical protein